jgi:hypothetical protein
MSGAAQGGSVRGGSALRDWGSGMARGRDRRAEARHGGKALRVAAGACEHGFMHLREHGYSAGTEGRRGAGAQRSAEVRKWAGLARQ